MNRRLLMMLAIVVVVTGVLVVAAVERRPDAALPSNTNADFVVIDKSDRTLTLLKKG